MSTGSPFFEVAGSQHSVEAWAIRHLPFEPDGWLIDYTAELRAGIGSLRLGDAGTLWCGYVSQDMTVCDVENVTLYNVGLSAFGHLDVSELVIERSFEAPPPAPEPLVEEPRHYHRYRTPAAYDATDAGMDNGLDVGRRPSDATDQGRARLVRAAGSHPESIAVLSTDSTPTEPQGLPVQLLLHQALLRVLSLDQFKEST